MKDKQTILHVITSLNLGGAETMMCQLLEHTDQSRFKPVVVSLRPSGPLAERIRRTGADLHCLDMGSYFSFRSGLVKLKAIMREVNPSLVQTWMYHADFLGTLAARSLNPRPPVVWNVQHGSFCPKTTKFLSRVMRALLTLFSRSWPDKIAVCSSSSIDLHARLGYPRDKMLHIVNGADISRFRPDDDARRELRKKLVIAPDAKVIGMAGRNDPQKDYPTFFAAIREFQKTDKDTIFIACGAGVTTADPGLARMRSLCPSPHNIFLLGPRQDMPWVYPAFDLATLSSAYGEGFPLALCEALACGVPCVATDVGDSGDVIGDCGITVRPGDPIALAKAWGKMLDLPATAQQAMREKSRMRAEKRFSLPAIAEQYEGLYSQLIAARQTSEPHMEPAAIPKPAAA
jgi:glycosyltransferase involved in cell wall biosynthesis